MFDEQPDGDPHGECAAEIDRLTMALKQIAHYQYDGPDGSVAERLRQIAKVTLQTHLQPCGHPWTAHHGFKCILCSAPGQP
jgi:hypothetical protein